MNQQAKATTFWKLFTDKYPTNNERVWNWIYAVSEGRADWFRNKSLTQVVISEHCTIGRFGYDDNKDVEAKAFVASLENQLGISLQW